MNKGWKIFLGVTGGLLGFLLLLLFSAQLVLSPRLCKSLVDRYAPQYVDGNVSLSGIRVSLLRHFPSVTADIDDLMITYPADRFDSLETSGVQNRLVYAGTFRERKAGIDVPVCPDTVTCSDKTARMDTLASFGNFRATLSLLPLLHGEIRVRDVELTRPRAFLHFYNDTTSNLGILKFMSGPAGPVAETEVEEQALESEPDIESGPSLPNIALRKLHLGERAHIVYSDQTDTLMALVLMQNMTFRGRISTRDLLHGSFRFDLDSLLVAGNTGKDTLLFDLNSLAVRSRRGDMKLKADAKAYMATHAFGRIAVPIALAGDLNADKDDNGDLAVSVRDFDIDIATVHIDTDMDVTMADSMRLKGFVSMPALNVQETLDKYAVNFYKDAGKIHTDAVVTARVDVDGWYDSATGSLPAFDASISLPECTLSHSDYPIEPGFSLEALANASQGGPVGVNVRRLSVNAPGLFALMDGSVSDVLGRNRGVQLNAVMRAALDTLGRQLGDTFNMCAAGKIDADIHGTTKLSGLSLYNLSGMDIKAKVNANGVRLASYDDSLNLFANDMKLNVALMENRFGGKAQAPAAKVKLLGAILNLDSLYFRYKDDIMVNGRNVSILAQTSPESVKVSDTVKYNPLRISASLGSLAFEGQDSLSVGMRDSKNTLSIHPDLRDRTVPVVDISSKNGRVRAKMGLNRVFLSNLGFNASGKMKGDKRKKMMENYMDSVFRAHPEWSRDSVRNNIRNSFRYGKAPQWMKEDDFRERNIKLDLGETFRKYFVQWDVNGKLSLGRAGIATPAYPLRTSVRGFQGRFDNNSISLDTLNIVCGASRVSMDGKLTNLRSALMRNGIIKLDARIQTDSLALIELLNAYAQGQKNLSRDLSYLDNMDDSGYEAAVAVQTDEVDTTYSLIVVPANLDARLKLRGKGVNYAQLDMYRFNADLMMKDRCLQVSDLKALSPVGKVYADAFYSTRNKKNVQAGFDITLDEIYAGQVIELLPQLDTLMPLLKSFDGLLNCNMAVTTRIDTNMNVITPTMDGIIRIGGKDLHFHDNKQIARIARILMFKHPERATIDSMTVEGVIKDNKLEIFPFILKMDRWAIAMAGVQSLDKSFHYHFSIAKSPFLLRFGANVYGPDFDNMKFKLGKAKYKSVDVPSFSEVIDTTRVNLVSSIKHIFEKGVDRAVREHRNQEALNRAREAANYQRSVALEEMEELSALERTSLDSLSTAPDGDGPDTLKVTTPVAPNGAAAGLPVSGQN